MKILVAVIVCQMAVQTLSAQLPPVNRRVHPGTITQTEPIIATSPVDPNILFASAVTGVGSFRSEGIYVSTDGGATWRGSDTCRGELLANHGGDPGVMINSGGRFILTHIGRLFPGMFSHTSTDMGLTWDTAKTITSVQSEDKGGTAVDVHSSSPFRDRLYAAYVHQLMPYPVRISYSSTAGSSWSASAAINGTPPARCSGGSVVTGPDGRVYVTWAGVISTLPFTEDFAGFAFSTDGGVSWTVNQNIFDMNGIAGTLPTKGGIRVNGLPQIAIDNSSGPRHGWLYIVTNEKGIVPAGNDPDVLLHRSTDGGASWSQGIRVNQDAVNNGKTQYFPLMDIDDSGGVNILFYDDRDTTPDSTGVMLARSTDGGDSWTEMVISDHRFQPKPIPVFASGYQGDHIALKAAGNRLHAMWMDDASGIYQVWYAMVDITVGVAPLPDAGTGPVLVRAYPNPFNATTTFEIRIPTPSDVRLRVYDVLGREVSQLLDGRREAGSHRVRLDGSGLATGVYFYAADIIPTSSRNRSSRTLGKIILLR